MRGKIDKKWAKVYGKILKEALELYVINKGKFAENVNSNEACLRQWFIGRSFPSEGNHDNICNVLETTIDDLSNHTLNKKMMDFVAMHISPLDPGFSIPSSFKKIGKQLTSQLKICYANGKNTQVEESSDLTGVFEETGKTQVVVFDFDGTLTIGNTVKTTWESIWTELGYDVEECRKLHKRFSAGEIDHVQWCKLTEEKFIAKECSVETLDKIVEKIHIIKGCRDTLVELKRRNIKIFIVSGSVLPIIQDVLKDLCRFTTKIEANDFKFSSEGSLTRIIGTSFDFEGKAKYIKNIATELKISAKDILFVGDSHNDKWVHESGAQTLCINPKQTDPWDTKVWNSCIHECKDLTEILTFVKS